MLSPGRRSELMSLIRSRGNRSTELKLATAMRSHGVHGWLRHLALPGRPDFTFRAEKVSIFVHGCFWHGCPKCYRQPRVNAKFWREKVGRNKDRDKSSARKLRAMGYSVLTVWECSLRNSRIESVIARIERTLSGRRCI